MAEDAAGQSPKKPEPPAELVTGNKPAAVGMPGTGVEAGFFRVRPWMRSDLLHQWIQSAGILIASVWGIYTFVWQDILVPSWAPAHINLDISLTPVEGRSNSEDGSEMTLKVTATNPSSRKLYLLSNTWQLFGVKRKAVPEQTFVRLGNEALRGQPLVHTERFIRNETGRTLAVGRIFDDDIIHPGETIDRSVLVRIPASYEAAEVSVLVPALTKVPNQQLLRGCRLLWQLTGEEDLVPILGQPSDSAGSATDGPKDDCNNTDFNLDEELQKFDPLMRVFAASKEVGIPIESPDSTKPAKTTAGS